MPLIKEEGSIVDNAGQLVPFEPTENDVVVAGRVRHWSRSHPGNLHYSELIRQIAIQTDHTTNIGIIKHHAEVIIEEIVNRRKGRFLKLTGEGGDAKFCILMDSKAIFTKVVTAIRMHSQRIREREDKVHRPKIAKIAKATKRPAPKPAAPKTARPAEPQGPRYRATQGERTIHSYALELISAVCSSHDENNLRILDGPTARYTLESEPDKERSMRLELRLRYVAAKSTGMSPVDFSERLLKVWGGSLVRVASNEDLESMAAAEQPSRAALPESQQDNTMGPQSEETQPAIQGREDTPLQQADAGVSQVPTNATAEPKAVPAIQAPTINDNHVPLAGS